MKNWLARIALYSTLALPAAGCVTNRNDPEPSDSIPTQASFSWHAEGWMRGTMTATMPNGDVYEGSYFEIDRRTKTDRLVPLWLGWEGKSWWRGWDGWGADLSTTMIYSPRILANLIKADGERMRCRFTLARPSFGIAGGAIGRCQLSDGTLIRAGFP